MIISTNTFKSIQNKKDSFNINILTKLNSEVAAAIREEFAVRKLMDFSGIYIDTKDVNDADLSGINEIIHSHYTLQNLGHKLVFVYRRKSLIEKWVETTGLDKFVKTAVLPAL